MFTSLCVTAVDEEPSQEKEGQGEVLIKTLNK